MSDRFWTYQLNACLLDLMLSDVSSNCSHNAGQLVAWDTWVICSPQVIVRHVNIGVANPAVLQLKRHVVRPGGVTPDLTRGDDIARAPRKLSSASFSC